MTFESFLENKFKFCHSVLLLKHQLILSVESSDFGMGGLAQTLLIPKPSKSANGIFLNQHQTQFYERK